MNVEYRTPATRAAIDCLVRCEFILLAARHICQQHFASSAVAYDPPDEQIKLHGDALTGLMPRGRGEDGIAD